MSRDAAIKLAETYFDSGGFKADLARRVAIPTESQNPERADELKRYLDAEIVPAFEALGFDCRLLTHPKARGPFLAAERTEDEHLPSVLCYGHGDVISRARDRVGEGALALRAYRKGCALLRPRRRRQQGPAHDRHCRHG